jgi:excisionase family DNA binding protein
MSERPVVAVVLTSELEQAHMGRALEDHLFRHGRNQVPPGVVALSEALGRQTTLEQADCDQCGSALGQSVLMSYTEVAERLRVSKRTVSRLVADGRLETVGRRIRRSAVEALS